MNHIKDYGGHIYVATGRNGILKVGYAGNALNRARGLVEAFAQRGDCLDSMFASGVISNPRDVEWMLIRFCERNFERHRPRGREWFTCADLDVALEFATSLVGELTSINLIRPWQKGGRSWNKAEQTLAQIQATTRGGLPKPCQRLFSAEQVNSVESNQIKSAATREAV